ncbi:MAG TPA: secretion system protein F [Gammaproteobacteria bacterium]|nr:secretion system protein F [Gammaproteobacteria bacterium]
MVSGTLFLLVPVLFFASAFLLGYLAVIQGRSFWGDYEAVFKESAEVNLGDMFLFIDPHRLFMYNVLALVVLPLLVLVLTGDLAPALGMALLVMVVPFYLYRSMRRKRWRAFERQLPEALSMISSGLGAGASLGMALESLVREQPAPLSQEFMLFLREQRLGVDFETSLRNMERRLPLADFHMFASALRISREVGGNLGEILERLADTLRRKATMEGKIESLTAQGKMQGYVMTALPVFLGFLLYFLEPEAMAQLFTTPKGWTVLAVVFIMESLGYVFIRKVTHIDV